MQPDPLGAAQIDRVTFDSIIFPMLTKTRSARLRGKKTVVRAQAKGGPVLFWIRPGHPDLDRAGELLLSQTEAWRRESVSRGPAD